MNVAANGVPMSEAHVEWVVSGLSKTLRELLQGKRGPGGVMLAGGYIRSRLMNQPVNDIDVFISPEDSPPAPESKSESDLQLAAAGGYLKVRLISSSEVPESPKVENSISPLEVPESPEVEDPTLDAAWASTRLGRVVTALGPGPVKQRLNNRGEARTGSLFSANAVTLLGHEPVVQVIHRWRFTTPQECLDSFDFTMAAAVVWWDGPEQQWRGLTHPMYFADLASKRLRYLRPVREEAPGGSMLRMLRFQQQGWWISMSCLAAVVARLVPGYCEATAGGIEAHLRRKLVEVDPAWSSARANTPVGSEE